MLHQRQRMPVSAAQSKCAYVYMFFSSLPPCPHLHQPKHKQAAYESAPLLPPEGSVKGPCLLGSLSYLTDEFDWGGEEQGSSVGASRCAFELPLLPRQQAACRERLL